MNLYDKAQLALKAAHETSMSGRIWAKDDNEVRVYLCRTNAARSEAGYIRIFILDGKNKVAYVPSAGGGKGSRTAEAEGEAALARYKSLRDSIFASKAAEIAAKKVTA